MGLWLSSSLEEAFLLFASDNHRQFGVILISFLCLADRRLATGTICKASPRPLLPWLWQPHLSSSASQPGTVQAELQAVARDRVSSPSAALWLSHRDMHRGTALAHPFSDEHVHPPLSSAALIRAKSQFLKTGATSSSKSHNGALKVEFEFRA